MSEFEVEYEYNFAKTLPIKLHYPTSKLKITQGVAKGNEFRLRLNNTDTKVRSTNHVLFLKDIKEHCHYAQALAKMHCGMESKSLSHEQIDATINLSPIDVAIMFDEAIDLSSDIKLKHTYIF